MTHSRPPQFIPVSLSSRAHCPPLSRCPRPCPALHAPRPRPAPDQPQTLPHAPRRCERPHAPQMPPRCRACAVTLCDALHAQTATEAHTSPCERVHALPPCPIPPHPRTRPERPRNAPVSLATRAHAPAHTRTLCDCAHCSNLHNVDRPTLCKAPKVRKMRKNTCKTA